MRILMSSSERSVHQAQRVVIDVRGPGEWIVDTPAGGRSLHVYRLAPADWLVSEVGCGNEGRGRNLEQALAALSAEDSSPDWWDLLADMLDGSKQRPADRAPLTQHLY